MGSRFFDKNTGRLLVLVVVFIVAALNIVATVWFGNYPGGDYSSPISPGDIVWSIVPFLFFYVLAPALICRRVIWAPGNSHVFPIAIATSLLVGGFLYLFFGCGAGAQCNLFKFVNIPIFWIGAFACLFPEKSEH